MKVRKRKRRTPPPADSRTRIPGGKGYVATLGHCGGAKVSFRHVQSPDLVVLEDMDADIPDVTGKFVKVAFRIPALHRNRFDGHAMRRKLIKAGARAVLLAPVLVPDVTRPETKRMAKGRKPREVVEAWFAEQVGVAEEDKAAALQMVFGWMDSEGL